MPQISEAMVKVPVHLLKPDRRAAPGRVDQPAVQIGGAADVDVAGDGLPERPHRRDVECVDGDLEDLQTWVGFQRPARGLDQPGQPTGELQIRLGHHAVGLRLQPQQHAIRAQVQRQMAGGACARRGQGGDLGRLGQRVHPHLGVEGGEDQPPAVRTGGLRDLQPGRVHSSPASTASLVCWALAIWRAVKPMPSAATPTSTAIPATHSSE